MRNFYGIVLVAGLVAGCSQFTTSKQEAAALQAAATAEGDAYVSCVTQNALSYTGQSSTEIGALMLVATTACQPALENFRNKQDAYLKTQIMMTDKALAESVDALNERAKSDIAAQLVNRTAPPAASGNAAAMAAPAAAIGAVAVAPAPAQAAPPANGWNTQQRIYLDCMAEQAKKYSGLNESATVVADVAQSRCRSYEAGSDAALEQEGRALVMGVILDAKLAKPGR